MRGWHGGGMGDPLGLGLALGLGLGLESGLGLGVEMAGRPARRVR